MRTCKPARFATAGLLALAAIAASGCPEQTAGEKAGAAIDEAIEGAKDTAGAVEDGREELADR